MRYDATLARKVIVSTAVGPVSGLAVSNQVVSTQTVSIIFYSLPYFVSVAVTTLFVGKQLYVIVVYGQHITL